MNEPMSWAARIPLWLWGVFVFAVTACIGSFLNVVSSRVPRKISVVWPPSHCFHCGAPIAARRNIPILSWFLLRGRCGECLAPFSGRHAFVEAAFAILCTYTVVRSGGPTYPALVSCVLFAFLFPLACIDLDTWTLPHALTFPGILTGLILSLPLGREVFLSHLIGAVIGFGILWGGGELASRFLGKEAMGGGDFMLFALIGAFMGPGALLPVIFLSSLQGSVVGLAVIGVRKVRENRRLGGKKPKDSTEKKLEEAEETSEGGDGEELEAAGDPETRIWSTPSTDPHDIAAADALLHLGDAANMAELSAYSCKIPSDGWTPDAHSIPFGPFLALSAIELVIFDRAAEAFFPWMA